MGFYRDVMLPRSIFIPFLLIRILLFPIVLFNKIFIQKKQIKKIEKAL